MRVISHGDGAVRENTHGTVEQHTNTGVPKLAGTDAWGSSMLTSSEGTIFTSRPG